MRHTVTPAARVSAAIDILDDVMAGTPVGQVLTAWARRSRFAGSGDREAVRDLVFDALRCRRSYAALGGAATGRGLMIGACRAADRDPGELFTGTGHAPAPLTADESVGTAGAGDLPPAVALDFPDWLESPLRASLGADFVGVMSALRRRAPVFLRVNRARIGREGAIALLAGEGIAAEPVALSPTALVVTGNARRIQQSRAYREGVVELQDAASQAVVDALPTPSGQVLDFCAGGGGKTLALAARTGGGGARFFAHDADPRRMRDLPARAARAGIAVTMLAPGKVAEAAPFDLVLLDVPCSGSGSWRRDPQGKWALTPDALARLCATQAGILQEATTLVSEHGVIAYVTCSLLACENEDQVARFLAGAPGWGLAGDRRFTPRDGGDGFYLALLSRDPLQVRWN